MTMEHFWSETVKAAVTITPFLVICELLWARAQYYIVYNSMNREAPVLIIGYEMIIANRLSIMEKFDYYTPSLYRF